MRLIFVRHGEPDYEHDCLTELADTQLVIEDCAAAAEKMEKWPGFLSVFFDSAAENPRLDIKMFAVVDGRACKVQAYPNATTGERLAKTLRYISETYNVQFEFCNPSETGETIVRLLGGETDG